MTIWPDPIIELTFILNLNWPVRRSGKVWLRTMLSIYRMKRGAVLWLLTRWRLAGDGEACVAASLCSFSHMVSLRDSVGTVGSSGVCEWGKRQGGRLRFNRCSTREDKHVMSDSYFSYMVIICSAWNRWIDFTPLIITHTLQHVTDWFNLSKRAALIFKLGKQN